MANPLGNPRYSAGYKYCRRCVQFLKTDSTRCPYCGTVLRTRRRKRIKTQIYAADQRTAE